MSGNIILKSRQLRDIDCTLPDGFSLGLKLCDGCLNLYTKWKTLKWEIDEVDLS